MRTGKNLVCRTGMVAASVMAMSWWGGALLADDADRIQPSAANPFYWQYKRQPVLLLGGSSNDSLFQGASVPGKAMSGFHPLEKVVRAGEGGREELDLLKSVGGNYGIPGTRTDYGRLGNLDGGHGFPRRSLRATTRSKRCTSVALPNAQPTSDGSGRIGQSPYGRISSILHFRRSLCG